MMMMSNNNNFNFPPNGYYNPPKPPVITKNYQEAVKYGDDKKYGGNGDGKVSAAELTSIKKVFDYASDYYKNMYEQSGDTKYMAWSDHYSRDSKATDNMSKNFSIFMKNDAAVKDGITDKGVTTLAGLDGQGENISVQDIAKQQFVNFKNDGLATTHYEDAVKYGDDKKYGGNGDGTVDARELANIKKTFDYGADYYKNQASSATNAADKEKFTAWSNYYSNDAKAAENMSNNKSAFQDPHIMYDMRARRPEEPMQFNATLQSVQALAGKDGDTRTLSLQDLAKDKFPDFVDNSYASPQYGGGQPMYNNQPPQYGGGQPMYNNQPPQYGGGQPMYNNQPPQYGGGQPMYNNQPPQYGGGQPQYGGGQPMYNNQPPQYGGGQPMYNNQPPQYGGGQPMYNNQPPQYGGGQPMYNNQPPQYGGGQPMYNNQPPQYGGGQPMYGMNAPFPAPQDLTYLKAKADNPKAWDGAAFAQGAVSRGAAVDVSRDGQLSYAEAINSPDGLLGNGILRLPPDSPQTRALWDALSGPDGTVNPQELAAAILGVDGDANGTVTAQEANKFLQDTMAKVAQNPNSVISTYNNLQAGASAFGLDKFLQNPEAATALKIEQDLNAQQQGQTRGDTLGLLQQAEQARLQYGVPPKG